MILGNTQQSTAVWARHTVLGWACQRRVFERLHSDLGVTRDTRSGALLACKGDIRPRSTKLQPC